MKPEPNTIDEVDFSTVYAMCLEYVHAMANMGREPKDIEHYMFEEAVMAVYGRGIWAWVNERLT